MSYTSTHKTVSLHDNHHGYGGSSGTAETNLQPQVHQPCCETATPTVSRVGSDASSVADTPTSNSKRANYRDRVSLIFNY